MESNHWLALGSAAMLAILGVYLLGKSSDRESIDKEQLIAFLDALARKWFVACRDTAELARSVRQKLVAQGVPLSDAEFKDQLLNHCGVLKKLEEIQHEALDEFNLNGEDVQEVQTEFADDPIVKAYSEGFLAMLEDSVRCLSPIMPNLAIPEELTEEKVLSMCASMQHVEIRRVHEHFEMAGGFLASVQVLGQVLALANKESETEVLAEHNVDMITFSSALAINQRKSPSFAEKKAQLDASHRDRMVKMFKPAPKDGKLQTKPAVGTASDAEHIADVKPAVPTTEVASPAEEVTSPAEEVTSPAEEVTSPAKDVATPAKDVATPAKEAPKQDFTVKEPSLCHVSVASESEASPLVPDPQLMTVHG